LRVGKPEKYNPPCAPYFLRRLAIDEFV